MIEVNKFDALKIGIASPEKIREWLKKFVNGLTEK